jgi:hypothetical protein
MENGQDPSSDFRRPTSGNRMRFLFTMSEIEGRRTDDGERIRSRRPSGLLLRQSAHALDETDQNCIRKDVRAGGHAPSVLRRPAPVVRLVEPDGIEPTTSCLQSTRSPN